MARTWSRAVRLLREDIAQLTPYPAPPSLDEFARSIGMAPEAIVKLDQNENPYGCSPRVIEALRNYNWFHVYPDPLHRTLRERLADYTGAPARQIVVGNGSDEIIEILVRLFVAPGDRIITADPTFGYYATVAAGAGAEFTALPRGPRFEVDLDRILAALDRRTKLVFLASPNNPTGNTTPLEVIQALLEHEVIVVVDEAYYEFCGRTALGLLRQGADNLVILRTFSKWAGLAGIRLGYGILPPDLADAAYRIRSPYSVSRAAEVAGIASLDDLAYLRSNVEKIRAERDRLAGALGAVTYLAPHPSEANFILCDVVERSAADLQEALARRGILVRRYSAPRLENSVRISVGRPEHTDRLLAALREVS
ncbi:MAG TPA: histidinol-phosphate transaminase [Chloroflexota bacterium]|nr:histidinol-phosphate transaminase [Chloroflexota bacterium]